MPGFKPILGLAPKVLILGSMPSQKSLASQQYYANPQNSFWWIMSQLIGFDVSDCYAKRQTALKVSKIAVWDVLYDCNRLGSADSAIQKSSEIPNDFAAFFGQQNSLKYVGFNGVAAQKIFMRHCPSLLTIYDLAAIKLPSTSPAYAAMRPEEKLRIWRQFLQHTN